jgi:hypothetical protein
MIIRRRRMEIGRRTQLTRTHATIRGAAAAVAPPTAAPAESAAASGTPTDGAQRIPQSQKWKKGGTPTADAATPSPVRAIPHRMTMHRLIPPLVLVQQAANASAK